MSLHHVGRRPLVTLLVISTSALVLGLAGCGGASDPEPVAGPPPATGGNVTFDAEAMIINTADNIITPTYVELDQRAAQLVSSAESLDDGGATEAELDAAQAAWRAARAPWEASEGFLFGPVDSLGIDPAIDSWPLDTPALSAFLAATPNATQQDVESASDDLRGFHAIEYVLFGDGVSSNDRQATSLTAPEIKYLVALSRAFKARTALLVAAWTTDFNGTGPFAATVKTPGAANASYKSQSAVIEEFVNGLAGIAAEVGSAKIGEPLGTSIGAADTTKVESQYSWNSLADFHDNVQSILNVYTGKRGFNPSIDTVSAGQNGLYAFVAAHDAALATRTLDEILDAQRKIALIKGDGDTSSAAIGAGDKPFRQQIPDAGGRVLIQAAVDALTKLQATLEAGVQPLIGKTTFGG